MRIARYFIGLAMVNFSVGVALGCWMAINPAMWAVLSPIHAELNPFGWLTLLIYGMTYAVLSSFAQLQPTRPFLLFLQLACAEMGVIAIIAGAGYGIIVLLQLGWILQALTPLLFLFNILTAVRAGKVEEKDSRFTDGATSGLIAQAEFAKATDQVAQRGTSLTLFCWIVSSIWMAVTVLKEPGLSSLTMPVPVEILTYYGWVAGMVLAVSLHLFPRFAGAPAVTKRQGSISQSLWLIGVLLATFGSAGIAVFERVGFGILGLSLIFTSGLYLSNMRKEWFRRLRPVSALAWWTSFCFAGILGVRLLFGLDPFSLPSLHLLFLGWATTLVYGVGYTLFPRLLNRDLRSEKISLIQIAFAVLGATLMPIGFFLLDHGSSAWQPVLAIGGISASTGALLFIVQWLFAVAGVKERGMPRGSSQ